MNPESTQSEALEPAFLAADRPKAEEADMVLKDSLASFLEPNNAPAPAREGNSGGTFRQPEGAKKEGVQNYDFRNPMLLSPTQLRKLRAHQEEFSQSMSSRLSIHLRSEFTLKLTGLQTIDYQKLAESWGCPAHLTLFKMEPLRGISILEISTQLGLCMVDRLMGGPGVAPAAAQEISEIEKALLEQTVQLFLEEWCGHWSHSKGLKPVILGYESNGAYIQNTQPDSAMLVVSMTAEFGECKGLFQLGVPFAAVEPLIRRICQGAETTNASPAQTAPHALVPSAPAFQWNTCFNEVPVPVTAEWDGLELTARQIMGLKVGDVLPLGALNAQQVNVRVADTLKFQGRPGTMAGRWAVELTRVIK